MIGVNSEVQIPEDFPYLEVGSGGDKSGFLLLSFLRVFLVGGCGSDVGKVTEEDSTFVM